MSKKRKGVSGANGAGVKRKRQWRPDANLNGHGVFMTCIRGKKRQASNDLIDIFRDMARKLYPDLDLDSLPVPTKCNKQTVSTEAMIDNEIDEMLNGPYLASRADSVPEEPTTVPTNDIEAELRAELAELKGPNLARGSKFRVCGLNILKEGAAPAYRHIETGTECFVYIDVHPCIDPFDLCHAYLSEVERTGEARSRFISRLSPVASFGTANSSGVQTLCRRCLPHLLPEDGHGTYKIDPRIRAHSVLKRDEVIAIVGQHVPKSSEKGKGYTADLKNPTHLIVVEIHKSHSALGVIRDYMRFCRYNPSELAARVRGKNAEGTDSIGTSRVTRKGSAGEKMNFGEIT